MLGPMAVRQLRDPKRARAAHLLRRATLTADAKRLQQLADQSWNDGVAFLVDEASDRPEEEVPKDPEDWSDVVMWWLDRMTDPAGGLRERLTWFWHTVLTTSAYKVGQPELLADQLAGLRANATGNYRELLHRYVTSGALLIYLDAAWSEASNPNENLGRELMELFTVGRGHYTQDDVRAAARALAGWVVEDNGTVEWRRDRGFVAPLLFRDIQDDWDTTKIIDHLCDQPQTATNIAGRLWRHLLGTELTEDGAAELGRWWQSRDLDILALTERILTDNSAEGSRLNRPRSGVEWYCAFSAATGIRATEPWQLERLGQMPYVPPNVGGWPEGGHWLMPGSLLGRLSAIADVNAETLNPKQPGSRSGSGTADEVLDQCGLFEVSDNTVDVVHSVRTSDRLTPEGARSTTWRLALASPEFQLS